MAENEAIEPEQRIALITGASRGIGAAISRALAAQGCACILNYSSDRSAPDAKALAAQLKTDYGVEAQPMKADVSDFDQAKTLIDDTKKAFGRIDVLVNNAGITRDGLLMRMKEEDFDAVIDVNLKGAFNCMRHASRVMSRQHSGRIISVASVVGVSGNAGQTNYAASKAGIIGLTKSAAKELAPRHVTVNAVAPGFISTDMTAVLDPEYADEIKKRIALGEFGKPEDVANAVAFFANPASGYITGQVLAIDGGLVL